MKLAWTALFLVLSVGSAQNPNSSPPTPAPAAVSNAPVVKSGVETLLNVDQLTGNNAVRMIASTNYQISIVFPAKVQTIGVNASKQNAVIATIDEYDGRVVYLDAMKAGGTATINFRLLTEADEYTEKTGKTPDPSAFGEGNINPNRDPVILKVLVDLTDKENGVLSYSIRKGTPKPVQAVTPAPVVKPAPAPAPVVKPAPRPATVKPTTFVGTSGGITLTVKLDDTAKTQGNQAARYTVELTKGQDGKTYSVDTGLTTFRVKNVPVTDFTINRGRFPLTSAAPVTGTLEIPKRLAQFTGARVLMFVVLEKDTVTQIERRRYVGVILK